MYDDIKAESRLRAGFFGNTVSVLVCLLPLLNTYSVRHLPGALSDIAIMCLVIMTAVTLLKKPVIRYGEYGNVMLLYAFVVFFSFLFHYELTETMTDYLRQFSMLFIAVFGLSRLGNFAAAFRTFEVTAIFSSIYCWLQVIFLYAADTILPSYLPFFEHRSDLDFENQYLNYKKYYRPHSIFSEPSIFCEYILLYLILLLFKDLPGSDNTKKYKKRQFCKTLFITATCFITGSTTGIIGSVIFLCLYFWQTVIKTNKIIQKIGTYIPVIAAAFLCLVNTPMFRIFVTRVFVDHSSLSLRFGNLKDIFNEDCLVLLFGRGFVYDAVVKEIGWIPGYALVLVYYGLAGLGILSAVSCILYSRIGKKNCLGKAVFLYFVIMNCTSYPLFSSFFLTDLFFIFHSKRTAPVNQCRRSQLLLAGKAIWNVWEN